MTESEKITAHVRYCNVVREWPVCGKPGEVHIYKNGKPPGMVFHRPRLELGLHYYSTDNSCYLTQEQVEKLRI